MLRSESSSFDHRLTAANADIVSLGMAENVPFQLKIEVLTRRAVCPLFPFHS